MIRAVLLLIIIGLSFLALAREDKVRLIEGREGLYAFYLGEKYCSKIVKGKWDEECRDAYEYHKYGRAANLVIKTVDDFIKYVRENDREKIIEMIADDEILMRNPELTTCHGVEPRSIITVNNKKEFRKNYDNIITPEFRKYLLEAKRPLLRILSTENIWFFDDIRDNSKFFYDGLVNIEIGEGNRVLADRRQNPNHHTNYHSTYNSTNFKDTVYLLVRVTCAEDKKDTPIILDYRTHLSRCKNYKAGIGLSREEEK